MPTIAQEKLIEIAGSTGHLIDVINEGVQWADSYLKESANANATYELKRYRRKLAKIKTAVIQKPVIALFGASQVGKSYLVKNILSDEKNTLMIIDPRNEANSKNFIQEMNPEGHGSESTSVVTRFTHSPNTSVNKLPVKIKLLSAKDIISILCDSYFSDYKKRKASADFKKNDIEAFVNTLPNYFSPNNTQYYLTEDDVLDIEDYMVKFFEAGFKNKLDAYKDANYWRAVSRNIHKIMPENWLNIFEILWGNQPKLSGVFKKLITQLAAIKFPKIIYSDFDAVLRKNGTILDVKCLKLLHFNTDDDIAIEHEDGKQFAVNRNTLCALSSEVILNISANSVECNSFIKEMDILDFPGARTRLQLDENEELLDDNISEMLLRGKVSYLFNSYSLNYEINNLFVCTHSKQSNVRGLPELVNNWIEYNIGKDALERTKTLNDFSTPPLYIVFTWWNNQLEYDQDNDNKPDVSYKWKHRFETLFNEELVGSYNWNKNWVSNGTFKNFYLLRDFKYSKDFFDGFESQDKEIGIRPERKGYYDIIKSSFLQSPLVKTFFKDPVETWEHTSTPQNDGSKFIISSIKEISGNALRTKRYLEICMEAKQMVETELNKYYHSDEADGQIRKAAKDGAEIHAVMNIIFGKDAYQFGNFIEHFTVSERNIFEYYHEKLKDILLVQAPAPKAYQLIREGTPGLDSAKSFDENVEVLRKQYHHATAQEVQDFYKKKDIDLNELFYGGLNNLKNSSDVLAEGARDYWFKSKLSIENFSDFIKLGFEEHQVERLLDNLKTSFDEKLHLTKIIAANIRSYVDNLKSIDLAEEMIAHITAGIINEFVNSVGWSFFSDVEKNKIEETNTINNLNLILPDSEDIFHSIEKTDSTESNALTIEKLINFMDNLNENLNRIPLDIETVKNVPMIKNYRRWRELMKISFIANCNIPTYNVEANHLLGGILNKIRLANFTLN